MVCRSALQAASIFLVMCEKASFSYCTRTVRALYPWRYGLLSSLIGAFPQFRRPAAHK